MYHVPTRVQTSRSYFLKTRELGKRMLNFKMVIKIIISALE